jgi:hypothetical protein
VSVDYASNDAVSLNGSSYYAAGDPAVGVSPPAAPWQQIAAKGDTGPQGATGATGPGVAAGGTTGQVLTKTSATDYATNWQTPTPGLTLPLSQNLTFSPDNAYSIGTNQTTNRPSYVYVANAIDTPVIGTISAITNFRMRSANLLRWQVDTNGHFTAVTDNTYDIGASAANRPRNIYAAGALIAGTYTEIPEIATPATPAAGKIRLYAKADHGLYILDSTGTERRLDITTLEGTTSYA